MKCIEISNFVKIFKEKDDVKIIYIDGIYYNIIQNEDFKIRQCEGTHKYCAIYITIHEQSLRYYIGKIITNNFYRFNSYKGSGLKIKSILNKYGKECKSYKIIKCNDQNVSEIENKIITENILNDIKHCCNLSIGGQGGTILTGEKEQIRINKLIQRNKDSTKQYITVNGETHSIKEWSNITGISYAAILNRKINLNWTPEECVGYKKHINIRKKRDNKTYFKITVDMCDLNGNVIRTFSSKKEAAKFIGLTTSGFIHNYNKSNCFHGYKWIEHNPLK